MSHRPSRARAVLTFLWALLVALSLSGAALAQQGWIHTGDAVRTKSVGPFTAKVYAIRHDMKARPAEKTRLAVVKADVDKKFTWRMLRDVESDKIHKALREAYQMNGYGDAAKINAFVGAFSGPELKEGSTVVITYSAAAKSTTIWVQGGGSATVPGIDFMYATWNVWFGRIDQPSLSDQLISKL